MQINKLLLTAVFAWSAVTASAQGGGPHHDQNFQFSKDNTPGWSLMTPEEQSKHREKMLSFKSYDECKGYLAEHHKEMEQRAKAQNKTLPTPHTMACDRMKARGFFK